MSDNEKKLIRNSTAELLIFTCQAGRASKRAMRAKLSCTQGKEGGWNEQE